MDNDMVRITDGYQLTGHVVRVGDQFFAELNRPGFRGGQLV
ncbi:hypothetical protein ACJGJ0_17570 [Xanthomonas citri pv. mangiferaeindicae]